jgi:hypothetical protein
MLRPWILVPTLATLACAGRTAQWEAQTPAGPPPVAAAPATDDGEAAWARRGERAEAEKAIAAWEATVGQRPDNALVLARLSRAYYFLAEAFLRAPADKDAYLANLEKGISYGERALAAADPAFRAKMKDGQKVEDAIKGVGKEGLEAMYWYAVNLGKWSRAKGLAALLGNKDRVFGVMSRALELDESFFHGAPHRYFGAYWALLPVGRDLDKSRQHFERSLAIAPNYAGTRVLMAEAYAVKKQDRALFQKLLDEVLATPDNVMAGLEPETHVEKDKARELKAKIDDLF